MTQLFQPPEDQQIELTRPTKLVRALISTRFVEGRQANVLHIGVHCISVLLRTNSPTGRKCVH